ncbi:MULTISPECIES: DUF6308 family protein [unclassified Arthrobacter]|uniref:DUF6308 family protein n=1 Tax=unclassified Arthrobacter TaxID=235627 RepID=UPI002E04FADE|nr:MULTISPECIES: DUF6308 family protein [unclassified Arthrobacter]MEC5192639.1 hypothetical protein [Arthrobacter sp. MP_M4]
MPSSSLGSLKSSSQGKLERYTSTTRGYAFNTYDHQGEADGPLAPADVLMANLLSLQLSARDVIPLFTVGDGPPQRLRQSLDIALVDLRDADCFESYDELSGLERAVESLAAANTAALSVKWWTAVTVSKVLHRRRPHIVPLIDSRVYEFYGTKHPGPVRKALWEDIRENSGWLTDLAATMKTPDGRPLSLLRLADILIWTP